MVTNISVYGKITEKMVKSINNWIYINRLWSLYLFFDLREI